MKKIVQNKKVLICILVTLILIIGCIFLFGSAKESTNANKETTNKYIAYVKINPIIKLEYSNTCKKDNCTKPVITKYELINEDAKNIYNNIDLIGTKNTLYDVLYLISKTAADNNIEFEDVEIYSNWNNLENYLNGFNKEDYKWSYIIHIRDKENLDNILGSLIENKVLYNVDFDTDGGNVINTQTVEKDSVVTEPDEPTKKGYKFVEWQLNGEKFDFNTKITSNITLKAKWEKEEVENKDDQKPDTDSKTKTKELSINNVEIRNSVDSYIYNLTEQKTIKVTITGKENIIKSLDESNVKLYVDVTGLKAGTHSVDIKISGIDSSVSYKLSSKTISVKITEKENNTPAVDDKFYSIEVDVNDITLEEIKDYVYNKRSYVVINVNGMQGAVCYSSEKSCTLTSPNEIVYIKQVNNAILDKFQVPHTSNGLLLIEGDEIGDETEYSCKEWYESHPEEATPGTEYSDSCIKYGDEYYGFSMETHINLLAPPTTKAELQAIIDNFEYGQGCAGDC